MFAIPLWLSGVLYDSQRLLYGLQQEIRVTELFELERSLFPAPGGGSWSEWFFTHNTPSLDIMTGLTYLAYIPFVLFVAAALFRIDKERCLRFAWAFFAVNVIGVIVYLAYPAAPPWYVMNMARPCRPLSPRNPAGAARFDELFGITVFKDFYARNPKCLWRNALAPRRLPSTRRGSLPFINTVAPPLHRRIHGGHDVLRSLPLTPLHPRRPPRAHRSQPSAASPRSAPADQPAWLFQIRSIRRSLAKQTDITFSTARSTRMARRAMSRKQRSRFSQKQARQSGVRGVTG